MQLPATTRPLVRFHPFTADLASHELHNNGRKISLQEKPFHVLAVLLEHHGQVVTREELRQRLWPADTFVDFEHSINTAIKKVREALEDSGDHPKFIETLPRLGYRFIAPVEVLGQAPSTAPIRSGSNHALSETPTPVESLHPLAQGSIIDSHRPNFEIGPDPSGTRVRMGLSNWRTLTSRRTAALLAVLSSVLLAVVAVIIWSRYGRNNGPAVTEPSIAVLAFADLSPGHDQEYLSDGLAEEILNDLAAVPNLKVVARTSAFQFKGRNEDTRVIGQKLNVATVLEGSVRREGNRVRITAQLIKTADGFHLWSQSFDRDLKDIFTVEDEIAKAITSALQLKLLAGRLPASLTTSRTTSPEAYEAFLHARYLAQVADKESETKGLDYASRAIRFDPNYASAYALRGYMELLSGVMAWIDLKQAAEDARRDAEKAIALDPNLADGYRVLSMIQSWYGLNCPEAEISLKRALDLAPADPDNLGQSALLAMCQGRLQEAVELRKHELLLDPLLPGEFATLSQSLRDLGRYEEAHEALVKTLDLSPKMSMVHEVRGEVYLAQGRPQEALMEMEKEPQDLYRDLGQALAYHALGRHQESDAALARLISQHSNDGAYQIAQAYAYRGEADDAFHWLDRAYAQHDSGFMYFKTDLKMKSLRHDPRHAQLLKLLNLPQ